jgi:hypothetical protein
MDKRKNVQMYIVFNIVILYWLLTHIVVICCLKLKWTAEETLCEKKNFYWDKIDNFGVMPVFFKYYMTLKKDVFSCDYYYK